MPQILIKITLQTTARVIYFPFVLTGRDRSHLVNEGDYVNSIRVLRMRSSSTCKRPDGSHSVSFDLYVDNRRAVSFGNVNQGERSRI